MQYKPYVLHLGAGVQIQGNAAGVEHNTWQFSSFLQPAVFGVTDGPGEEVTLVDAPENLRVLSDLLAEYRNSVNFDVSFSHRFNANQDA